MARARSSAFDIARILATGAIGTVGTDIFVAHEPDDVTILSITIYDTPGESPNPKWLREEPTVQIRIRGTKFDYQTAFDKMQEVKDYLLGKAPTLIGDSGELEINYVRFLQLGDIFSLGRQDDRPIIVSNWRLIREMESGGNRQPL